MKKGITLMLLIFVVQSYGQVKKCILKGTIINRNSKELLLFKATEDIRNTGIVIPITNNTFEYVMAYENQEAYQLIFKDERDNGMWKPIVFFPENSEINLTLNSVENFEKNKITGELNKEYQDFNEIVKTNFYSKVTSIQNQLKKGHLDKTVKAKVLAKRMDSLFQEYSDFRVNFIKENPSKVSYYLLYDDVKRIDQFNSVKTISIFKNYFLLSKVYPKHPYTNVIRQTLESHQEIKVGGVL